MTVNFASGTVWTGDNLPVMRGINSESVDLIYLDPPFNSNRTYEAAIGSEAAGAAFKDAWTLDDVDVHEHGELADRNPAAYSVIEAADRLQREWAGIDLSPLAVKLVDQRIQADRGELPWGGAIGLTEPPKRTDLGELPNYRTHRHRLYGEQEGVCVGCNTHFPFRVMDVDHILPRSRGGTDHPDNLQLLCSGCNRSKGGKTMAEWKAASREG